MLHILDLNKEFTYSFKTLLTKYLVHDDLEIYKLSDGITCTLGLGIMK